MNLKEKLENVRLHLNDVFYSVQGEGRYMGVPTLFFRFNKCNIPKCQYCDTSFEKCGIESVDVMTALIKNFIQNYPIQHICFTGGEPLLFKDDIVFLVNFIKDKLHFNNFSVKIETNGTFDLELDLPFTDIIYTITPKHKYIDKYICILDVIDRFNVSCDEIIFKYMVDVDNVLSDLDLIYKFIQKFELFSFPVYLSPINKNNNCDNILTTYSSLIRQLNNCENHIFFKDVELVGITIQLNKLLEWQ
ncbi:hypothetical protein LCGC14_0560330 [marine sediment metagenome]|uniref:Radical SAM core domain-containing protein n=1 Tax=marine sediment metagenome TaxID=412755 RepID=A0A0F9RM60_9ZZZZ